MVGNKKPQGFGYLKQTDPDKLKEVSSAGGTAVQKKGTGHKWSPEEARNRGAAGGRAAQANRRSKGE